MVKNLPANAGDVGSVPCGTDPLEEEMVTHFSVLAWKTPWTEDPGRATVHGVTLDKHIERLTTTDITGCKACCYSRKH